MQIGMNLSSPVYWSGDFPFNDLMKSAGDWAQQGNAAKPVVETDAKGWPLAIPDGATRIYAMIPMTGEEQVIHVHYEGVMEFKFQSATKVLEARDGYARVSTRSASGVSTQFIVTSLDPSNPPTSIAVVPDKCYEAWKRGEIFTASFLANPLVCDADVLRFMDWLETNGSTRTDMGAAEDMRSYIHGVPLTVCLKLANLVGAVPYINIPEHATDATILAMGSLCPLGTIFEHSNEVWNTGFPYGRRIAGTPATKDKPAIPGLAELAGLEPKQWIGRRMGQVALLLEKVGQKLAVGYQPTADNPRSWDKWEAAFKATGAKPGWIITSAYPYGGLNSLAKITPYMEADDVAGVQQALATDVLECRKRFDNAAAIAARFGCGWMVYEGNAAHLNTSRSTDAAVAFVAKVQRDPGMRAIGEALLNHALDAGCETFCAFDLSSRPSRYGYFGVSDTPFGDVLRARMSPPPLSLEERVAALEAWREGFR